MADIDISAIKMRTKKRKRRRKTKQIWFLASLFVVLLFLFVIKPCYLKSTVAKGVSVCGVDVSGMTKKETIKAVSEKAKELDTRKSLTFVYKDTEVSADAYELSPVSDVTSTVSKAWNIGKEGSVFSRIFDLLSARLSGTDIEIEITLDYKALEDVLTPVIQSIPGSAKPAKYEISGNELIVTPGEKGMMPDFELLYNEISSRIFGREKTSIEIKPKKSSYKNITAEEIYKKFHSEVKNAEFIKNSNGNIVISPSSEGVDFDIEEAREILDGSKGKSVTIPIKYIAPDITSKDLEDKLYTDELSSYNSFYGTGNADRNINVELSCSKMNGTELLPGEVFSYVGAVGQGTYEEGYVDANIYADGQIKTGVAGGICQGSSTLYSAVLFADLEIVQRVNHSMPVGYVPRGMDATIAVPYIDFKFKNSTNYPVKISAIARDGLLDIRILGYNENPAKTVEITNKVVSETPFETKEVVKPEMAAGTEFVKQNGTDGCVVETYKTIKINGVEESTYLVSTSTYDPITKIVEVHEKTEDKKEEIPEDKEISENEEIQSEE